MPTELWLCLELRGREDGGEWACVLMRYFNTQGRRPESLPCPQEQLAFSTSELSKFTMGFQSNLGLCLLYAASQRAVQGGVPPNTQQSLLDM